MSSSTEYETFESCFLVQGVVMVVIVLIVGMILFELWRISRRQKKDDNNTKS